jgi:hypothetical protein
MTIPDRMPNRLGRGDALTPQAPASTVTASAARAPAVGAQATRAWLLAALLLSAAAQLITIAALLGADPIPATWAAVLLAVAPAPLALLASHAPAQTARLFAALAAVVLIIGIVAQITHTGLFFVPALAAMAVAAIRLWREPA